MNRLRTIFCALILGVPAATFAQAMPDPLMLEVSFEYPVVELGSLSSANKFDPFCTAFYVGKGYFASAGHCTTHMPPGDASYAVRFRDGLVEPVNVAVSIPIAEHLDDFGLFRILDNPGNIIPVKVECKVPEVGDPISIEGFPFYGAARMGFSKFWGHVASTADLDSRYWPKGWLADMTSFPGDSGSPVFDVDHHVVGILVGGPAQDNEISVVNSTETLCELMDFPA